MVLFYSQYHGDIDSLWKIVKDYAEPRLDWTRFGWGPSTATFKLKL